MKIATSVVEVFIFIFVAINCVVNVLKYFKDEETN